MQCSETAWPCTCGAAHSAGQRTGSKAFWQTQTYNPNCPSGRGRLLQKDVRRLLSSIPVPGRKSCCSWDCSTSRFFRCELKAYKRSPCKEPNVRSGSAITVLYGMQFSRQPWRVWVWVRMPKRQPTLGREPGQKVRGYKQPVRRIRLLCTKFDEIVRLHHPPVSICSHLLPITPMLQSRKLFKFGRPIHCWTSQRSSSRRLPM